LSSPTEIHFMVVVIAVVVAVVVVAAVAVVDVDISWERDCRISYLLLPPQTYCFQVRVVVVVVVVG